MNLELHLVTAAHGMLRYVRVMVCLHAERYATSMGVCHDLAVMAK